MKYQATYDLVSKEDYIYLRVKSGLSAKTLQAAAMGLANSICCVSIVELSSNKTVGMGRLIGDGGCHCQVVDICVLPEHQGHGLGKLIMSKLDAFIQEHIPDSCYINLIADGEAYQLYEKFGFKGVWPSSRGMGYVKKQ